MKRRSMKKFYLINVNDGEIVDVISDTLENAKIFVASILGGTSDDYIERM